MKKRILALAVCGAAAGAAYAGSTRPGELFMPQGGGAGTANGDFIMADPPGLNTFYRYFIEVPAGTSRLVVDLFDADVGAGGTAEAAASRDRARGGSFNTTATYSLRDPSGTSVTINFTTGNVTTPPGADNTWLTLYDSAAAVAAPAFGSSATATVNTATSVTVTNPAGTAVGDLLIGIVAVNAQPADLSASAGWTELDEGNCAGGANTCRMAIFYRYYDGTGASVTFSWNGVARKAIAGVLRYTGAAGVPAVGTAATGNSAAPTAPSVTTSVANTRIVRVFAAGNDVLSGAPYPGDHTGRYALQLGGGGSDLASGAADRVQAAAGATGTAAFALTAAANWRAQTVVVTPPAAPAPTPGHWELRVDQSTSTGNDLNALGIRAHDGTAGAGGTEIPVYYDSHSQLGANPEAASPTRSYQVFPYLTSGCSCFENDFDYDVGNGTGNGPAGYEYGRVQFWTRSYNGSTLPAERHQDIASASLSGNNVWQRDTVNPWTSDTDADEYGVWRADVQISTYTVGGTENGNYTNFYMTNYAAGTAQPASNPTPNAFRIYLPTDGDTPPVKPYMKQHVRHVSGPNPPGVGQTERVRVTVSVVNPTASAITFSTPSNVVTVRVPGAGTNGTATYVGGSRQASQGSFVSAELPDGGTGDITWNPGTVSAGSSASMAYDVYVTPSGSPYTIPVVGTVASGNGTRGQWLDETGNASQARATYLFGPLCELVLRGAVLTEAWVSGMWAELDARGLVVNWETVSEVGTAGFELYRRDTRSGAWEKVHDGLLPALHEAPQGGVYRFLDREAPLDEAQQYALLEVRRDGSHQVIGPFELEPGRIASRGESAMPEEGFTGEPRRARRWRATQGEDRERPSAGPQAAPGIQQAKALQVGVDALGLYAIPTSAVGPTTPLGGRPGRTLGGFSVTNRGLPVAFTLTAAQDAILFVGDAIDSVFTSDNVYLVSAGNGQTMATVGGTPPMTTNEAAVFQSTVHAEVDRFPATVVTTDPRSDYWYWDYLNAGDANHRRQSFPVELADLAAGNSATIAVALFGATSTGIAEEHRAVVRVNGSEVGQTAWQGAVAHTAHFTFPASRLQEGGNTVEVEAVLDATVPYSIFYVDSFDLTYPRRYRARGESLVFTADGNAVVTVTGFSDSRISVFDITKPTAPKIVTAVRLGGVPGNYSVSLTPATPTTRYLAVSRAGWRTPKWSKPLAQSTLKTPGRGAEYLVIAGTGLSRPAEALAAHRAGQGLSAAVVTVDSIMDEFNFGISDPNAIAAFLKYAWNNWQPRPRFVALAGAGTLDYRDLWGLGGNLVPPIMVSTPSGLFASDAALADLVGADGVPDVAIGRLPARSASELDAMVGKIVAYEGSAGEGWANRALLLADSPLGADFSTDSDRVAAALPAGYRRERIYLSEMAIPDARSLLLANLASGAGLVNYVGHGAIDRLSAQGLLTSEDVDSLTNGSRAPVFVTLTCTVNRFELPQYPCLGQELTTSPVGGAIAVWGPSGLSENAQAGKLGKDFLAALDGGSRLGEAVLAAARKNAALGLRGMVDIYNLLGDPALMVKVPLPSTPPGGGGTGGE